MYEQSMQENQTYIGVGNSPVPSMDQVTTAKGEGGGFPPTPSKKIELE